MKPYIFFESKYNKEEIEKFKKSHNIWSVKDIYKNQLKELFEIRNPKLVNTPNHNDKLNNFIESESKKGGNWIYFPWSGILVHTVNEYDYFDLRTNRNKNLITKLEQEKLYNSCIGIAGLSVGTNTATALAYQGVAKNFKLAEFDHLSSTNLNRVKTSIASVGENKIDIASQQIYEINPYANLIHFATGLDDNNLYDFINKPPVPAIIFELLDDFKMKIKIRLAARKARIPVIMLTNLADNILIDIERYDLNPNLDLFNGLLGGLPAEILTNEKIDPKKYALQLVGKDNVPERAIKSLQEIGNTLVGRPQLFSTLSISSGLGTYLAREILLGKSQLSGRKKIKIPDLL